MAIINWPTNVPTLVNSDSFSVEMGDTTIRSEVDVGPQKVRRRSTRPVDTYTISMDLDRTEVLNLKTFFNTTTNGGVTAFYFEDPLTGIVEVFKFAKPPSFSPIGSAGYYKAVMTWYKQP